MIDGTITGDDSDQPEYIVKHVYHTAHGQQRQMLPTPSLGRLSLIPPLSTSTSALNDRRLYLFFCVLAPGQHTVDLQADKGLNVTYPVAIMQVTNYHGYLVTGFRKNHRKNKTTVLSFNKRYSGLLCSHFLDKTVLHLLRQKRAYFM